MGFLRRIFGRGEQESAPDRSLAAWGLPADATPGDMLDTLEQHREAAENVLLRRYTVCPECASDYLRVGAWAAKGSAGWTVTCVNCGLLNIFIRLSTVFAMSGSPLAVRSEFIKFHRLM